jgi:hypothetical protein
MLASSTLSLHHYHHHHRRRRYCLRWPGVGQLVDLCCCHLCNCTDVSLHCRLHSVSGISMSGGLNLLWDQSWPFFCKNVLASILSMGTSILLSVSSHFTADEINARSSRSPDPYLCLLTTNSMHCLFLAYWIEIPLHVSGINSPSSGGNVYVCMWQMALLNTI